MERSQIYLLFMFPSQQNILAILYLQNVDTYKDSIYPSQWSGR